MAYTENMMVVGKNGEMSMSKGGRQRVVDKEQRT